MRDPVRRLIANAGALPAKQLLKLGHSDTALFEPLTKENPLDFRAFSAANGRFRWVFGQNAW